jgi:hypothetical protein
MLLMSLDERFRLVTWQPIGATIFSRIRYNAFEIDLGDGS